MHRFLRLGSSSRAQGSALGGSLYLERTTSHFSPLSLSSLSAQQNEHSHLYYSTETQPRRKIRKVMAANRGEIAVRIFRAATEMGLKTASIYSYEDRLSQHRIKSDESFMVGEGLRPVEAYLNIPDIVRVAVENDVDAVHPGYGFLSENAKFAEALNEKGIHFIGPPSEVLRKFGDKTEARKIAIAAGVPVVPGSDGPVNSFEEAAEFVEKYGFPVIIKAAHGGGGRGMRVVREMDQLEEAFRLCSSEALSAFGDGTVFLERYVDKPRHIEVQILADGTGKVSHLYERDCSVQRRYQKVIEMAPSQNLESSVRESLCQDAVNLAKSVGYRNAGTVEFLLDQEGRHYFMEVNPRIQVEHTVTEEVTSVDLVKSQIRITDGQTLQDLGLTQDKIRCRGVAIQARITTENPLENFKPDTGRIDTYRSPNGYGIRLDSGMGHAGSVVSPYYDSLLVKLTARDRSFMDCVAKLRRGLQEFRIRGVHTNIPFLMNVLDNPDFLEGNFDTSFIDSNPSLFRLPESRNRGNLLLKFLANVAVNGSPAVDIGTAVPPAIVPEVPQVNEKEPPPDGFRKIFLEDGPKAFAKAVREHKGALLMDTTWRDAHQSLLATRVRTNDLIPIAPATARAFSNFYSLECWGGATFDVAMRFLKECPWERLRILRELVPNVPFQMLLRGANAVGYTSYPDNVVKEFCKEAKDNGVDVFRVFDSLNYLENMRLGIDAVGEAGGIIEGAICYTGDVTNPKDGRYDLDYYLKFARELVDLGVHVLAIKDMAGLLKPQAARMLVGALRAEYPDIPLHIHTHDTPGTGVASMLECIYAGADVVDAAVDSLSGMTSQPSMGAIVGALARTEHSTNVDFEKMNQINEYWEQARQLYAPFESGQKSGSADVYLHEMPGGQYTNLLWQSLQLGLTGQWNDIKKAYASANKLLGDIVKVTPSSKVVGDMAQFMVQNKLTEESVKTKAETLSFPSSVVDYFQGYLGIPSYGFPEDLRDKVIKNLPKIEGRPGASLEPMDFQKVRQELEEKFPWATISNTDIMSYAMYPKVFEEYKQFSRDYADVSVLPTRFFFAPMEPGEEVSFTIEKGKKIFCQLQAVGAVDNLGFRTVYFELNGTPRALKVEDTSVSVTKVQKEKANLSNPGSIGAPMPGLVVGVQIEVGDEVARGSPLVVLSAMKMETIVTSPIDGVVERIAVVEGDSMEPNELLVVISKTDRLGDLNINSLNK